MSVDAKCARTFPVRSRSENSAPLFRRDPNIVLADPKRASLNLDTKTTEIVCLSTGGDDAAHKNGNCQSTRCANFKLNIAFSVPIGDG